MKKIILILVFMSFGFSGKVFGQNTFSLSEFNQTPQKKDKTYAPRVSSKVMDKDLLDPKDDDLIGSSKKVEKVKKKSATEVEKVKKKSVTEIELDSLKDQIDSLSIRNYRMTQKEYRQAFEDIDDKYHQFKQGIGDMNDKFSADSAVKADPIFKGGFGKKIEEITKAFDVLTIQRSRLLNVLNNPDSLDIKRIDKIVKKCEDKLNIIEGGLAEIGAKLDIAKSKSRTAIETLPTLIATSAFFVPTVNLLGSYVNRADGLAINIQLFKGGTGSDSLPYNNLRRLLVPQSSSLGISLGINKSLFSDQKSDSKRIGFSSNFYFLFKDVPNHENNKDVPSINTAMFQNTTNIDFIPLKSISEVFSMYGGWNFIWVMNQRDNLNRYFGVDNHNFINYFNVGFRLNIPLVGDGSNTVVIDINNLFINDNLRKLYKTTDALIPLISIGVKRSIVKL